MSGEKQDHLFAFVIYNHEACYVVVAVYDC